MAPIHYEIQDKIACITFQRPEKSNAFDDIFLQTLKNILEEATQTTKVRALFIKAQGRHFCAGADAAWMQKMAHFSEAENLEDARVLSKVLHLLYHSPKPTVAAVQGAAFGGGAGLLAACDIVIAEKEARFCFSETKLGLVPATISPYVVKAIGERAAKWLFTTAEVISAQRALSLQLITHCVSKEDLAPFSLALVQSIPQLAPLAVQESKALVHDLSQRHLDEKLEEELARFLAKKRCSPEGQCGLQAFLKKERPQWDES